MKKLMRLIIDILEENRVARDIFIEKIKYISDIKEFSFSGFIEKLKKLI